MTEKQTSAFSTPAEAQPHDVVDDASLDSFPASDAPGWSGFRAGAPVHGEALPSRDAGESRKTP